MTNEVLVSVKVVFRISTLHQVNTEIEKIRTHDSK